MSVANYRLRSAMDEQLTISTPEQVAFHYEMAGIGSRFVAALLDHLILAVILVPVLCAVVSLAGGLSLFDAVNGSDSSAGYIVLAILVLIQFLIFWGYFVIFEAAWNGQTPGKRAGRLRVIRQNGQPIGPAEAIIRNLVRIVDFMPGFYGIGLLTMFIDKDARRLGDMAANTIVIREGEETNLQNVRVAQPPASAYPSVIDPNQPHLYPYSALAGSAPSTPQPTLPDPLPGVSLREVTSEDYQLIRELLNRTSRGELPYDRGEELALQLASGVAARMGHDFRQWQQQGWTARVFLQSVLAAHDTRGQ
jgi:uncharacterized RDD family membrane protein YckC